ncbi:hypothetical protein GB937_006104 [Aspergillus fischeri]|nr:hypothetical protein GB937_006104 [Aspergillus fischeri]
MAGRQHIVPGIIEMYHLQLSDISREFQPAVIDTGSFCIYCEGEFDSDAKPCGDGAKNQSLPIILRIKMAVLHTFAWQDSRDSPSILLLSIGTRP